MPMSSQHGFTRGKSALINLTDFYSEMTGLVDDRRVVDVPYLHYSNAFASVSHNILIDQFIRNRLQNFQESSRGL